MAAVLYAVRPNEGYFSTAQKLTALPDQKDRILKTYIELASAKPVVLALATTTFSGAGTRTVKLVLTAVARRMIRNSSRIPLRVTSSETPISAAIAPQSGSIPATASARASAFAASDSPTLVLMVRSAALDR